MTRLAILVMGLLVVCCTGGKKSSDFLESTDEVKESNKIDRVKRLERIRIWRDSTRILELPFRANFDTTTNGTFRVKFWEADSIFRNDFRKAGGDVYLMGQLSDTTNFYAFTFVSIAAVGNPGVVTFDKYGNNVDVKLLTKESCVIYAGDILLCKEYTIIGKDWSLDYYFKSIVAGEGNSTDTVCSHAISRGMINNKGEIDLGQVTKINCRN